MTRTYTAGMDEARFNEVISRFDAANREDPNLETFDGVEHPKELLYARRMSVWLEKLEPAASEVLRLAARCQHIKRWSIPRGDYPMDKRGYMLWRTTLAKFHAETAGNIMRDVGYDDEMINRVGSLLRKEKLKADPEVQLLEDVICMVFLESYFADFATQHNEKKLIDIVHKTWKKMSPRGHEAALNLELSDELGAIVAKALAG